MGHNGLISFFKSQFSSSSGYMLAPQTRHSIEEWGDLQEHGGRGYRYLFFQEPVGSYFYLFIFIFFVIWVPKANTVRSEFFGVTYSHHVTWSHHLRFWAGTLLWLTCACMYVAGCGPKNAQGLYVNDETHGKSMRSLLHRRGRLSKTAPYL